MPRDDLISRTLVSGTGALLVFIVGIYITRLFSWSISVNGELCKWLASGTVLSDCSGASITPFKMSGANVDVLTATATHLRSLLEKGTVSSADLVAQYLQQIERHNHQGAKLNAMISTVPRELLLETAKELDRERAAGKVRGLFHGIPIVVKVRFVSELRFMRD
jgi:Amidase